MSHSKEMIMQLQPFQRNSSVYRELFQAQAKQFDNRDAIIADLKLQLSVDTATWALVIYEEELDIPVDTSKPNTERRSVIKSKMRGTGQVDGALIKTVADAFTNGDVEVTFDGKINIKFTSVLGVPPNMDDLKSALDDIKPSHLRILYLVAYLLVTDAEAMTITELDSTSLSKFAGGV